MTKKKYLSKVAHLASRVATQKEMVAILKEAEKKYEDTRNKPSKS
jgi:hypothetical protein